MDIQGVSKMCEEDAKKKNALNHTNMMLYGMQNS